jgi:Retrotransposon gag protein/Zinc knuckle
MTTPQEPADVLAQLQRDLAALQNIVNQQNHVIQQQNHTIAAIPAPAAPPAPPPAPTAPILRVKPDRPAPFTGKRSESLEAWIFQMQQFCTLAQVPIADRVPLAATFFKDQAALWWRSYYQTQNWTAAPPNWDEFLAALRTQFIPVNTSISAYDRLQRLSQKTSVNAYNHQFREIMLELPDMDDATKMNYYLKGLKENLRPFVAMQNPVNLIAAETIAERVDAVTYKPQPRTPANNPRSSYRPPGGVIPMDLDSISKLTDAERDRLRKTGGCFRCRKSGHMARDCPLPNRTNPRINAIDLNPNSEEPGKE